MSTTAHSPRATRSGRLAALVLLVQMVASTAAVYADALLEAAQDRTVHVESADADGACGTVHDHLFCQLCRAAGVDAMPSVNPLRCGGATLVPAADADTPDLAAASRRASAPLGARAPPLV